MRGVSSEVGNAANEATWGGSLILGRRAAARRSSTLAHSELVCAKRLTNK
jgi:hypothetical protein